MRIEITGPIGSGKTTLAEALASHLGWQVVVEVPEHVPFWADTYSGVRNYQFEKDLGFLLAHSVHVREQQPGCGVLVCDFSFLQDLAYAQLSQRPAELAAYEVVYEHLIAACGLPDLIINLRCSTPTLLARIAKRGRDPEQQISARFLESLVAQIDGLLEKWRAPVVEIDSEHFDFRQRPADVVACFRPLLAGHFA